MNHRLRADVDVPIRIGVWAVVIVVGVVALEPAALYLRGSPLVGVAAIGAYFALARLALALTVGALHGPAKDGAEAPGASDRPGRPGRGGAMSFQIFSHGAAVLLCGLGPLPGDLAQAVPYVTLRLGGLFLGLGLAVTAVLYARMRKDPYLPSSQALTLTK